MCSASLILLNYIYFFKPNAVSLGLRARDSGPRIAAKKAQPRAFVSVFPARYIAATAETAVRRYEAAAACNAFESMWIFLFS